MNVASQQEHRSVNSTESAHEVNRVIDKAIRKVDGTKENDLCKFLPVSTGGYIHHFTLRKMKIENPSELSDMISKFIINIEKPGKVTPKTRAARGSRKKRDIITLTRTDIEKMLTLARQVGDTEMIGKLSPKKSLAHLKRELVNSIKAERADSELWSAYAAAITFQNTIANSGWPFSSHSQSERANALAPKSK